MSDNRRPFVIVFDVNETLLDLSTLEPLFERRFGNRRVMREWFAQLILYSEAMTLYGLYTPFGDLAAGVLRMVGETSGVAVDDDDVTELKQRIGSMPALPDVAPALQALHAAGFRLVTLTNSVPGPAPTTLERAGIDGYFERSFSVHAVRRFKPATETYAFVASELGVQRADLCIVAFHLWDTIGAQAAGCSAAPDPPPRQCDAARRGRSDPRHRSQRDGTNRPGPYQSLEPQKAPVTGTPPQPTTRSGMFSYSMFDLQLARIVRLR